MTNLSEISHYDIHLVVTSWNALIGNEEYSMLYLKYLLQMNPGLQKVFKKFDNVPIENLQDNDFAIHQAHSTWKAISKGISYIGNGEIDAANNELNNFITYHQNIQGFEGKMFEVFILTSYLVFIEYYSGLSDF
ncbi:hypothetical protein A3Q56_08285 [Intoshia linei]|uniref:Globin domain-containing protein n=1 Tax=Intoshia linei TaxID=1819745 RepID=A0A177ARL2_9BILA|nr:hypothetical protein A3Q56_08285 [Intoshia linei]